MLRRILTIFGKEMLDTLRDRRTLAVMILAPILLMPVFTLLPQFLLGGQLREEQTNDLVISVQGAAHGPELIAYLQQEGAEIVEVDGDADEAVRDKRANLVLVIAPGFQEQMATEQPAAVSLVYDNSNLKTSVTVGRVQSLVDAFAQRVATKRLEVRGLDPVLVTPVQVERVNVATKQQMGGMFLGMFVPMFLLLFAFLGGMYTAIDVTAGEKERGTLEALLQAPVSRTELVLGKLLAVFVTSFAAVILSLLSTFAAFQIVPNDLFGTEMSFALAPGSLLSLILIALPLTLLLNAVEMIVCISARSFKEAQNYITPLQLVLMLPAFVVGFIPGFQAPAWIYLVPALGQVALFRDILAGTAVNNVHLLINLGATVLCMVLAIAYAVRSFQREAVIFRT